MNTRIAAIFMALFGTAILGLASAYPSMGAVRPLPVFAAPSMNASVGLNVTAKTTSNQSTIALPKYTESGWHYLASADPTNWGVLSTQYYVEGFFNVSNRSYFLFSPR